MNKQQLNNEIILCRPAVRRAKVIVIRKIIKKMKILKSCKVENLKEKKLKKSERLFKKLQLMKKVKDDDVTKFALRNASLDNYFQGPKIRLKENVLACLAKHKAVATKVSSIREKFQNWETELPVLLDSLGKKKNSARKGGAVKKTDKPTVKTDKGNDGDAVTDTLTKPKVCKEIMPVKPGMKKQKNSRASDGNKQEHRAKNSDDDLVKDISRDDTKAKKVDDPFFIDKKVIQPKLHEEGSSGGKGHMEVKKLRGENGPAMFKERPFRAKKESVPLRATKSKFQPTENELHPSWAAKKVKMIKPFEGKKIVFSEE